MSSLTNNTLLNTVFTHYSDLDEDQFIIEKLDFNFFKYFVKNSICHTNRIYFFHTLLICYILKKLYMKKLSELLRSLFVLARRNKATLVTVHRPLGRCRVILAPMEY